MGVDVEAALALARDSVSDSQFRRLLKKFLTEEPSEN